MSAKPGSAWWILGMGAISTYGEEPEYPGPGIVTEISYIAGPTFITLSWSAPTDGFNTGLTYVITRDGVVITETAFTEYSDYELQLDTQYTYGISSKNGYGIMSEEQTIDASTLKEYPVISHTATGEFTVVNYEPSVEYAVFTTNDVLATNVSMTNDVATFDTTYGDFKIDYLLSGGATGTSVSRLKPTGGQVRDQTGWYEHGAPCHAGNDTCYPSDCTGTCGHPTWGPWYYKEDNPPSGYVKSHADWIKIDNPSNASTLQATENIIANDNNNVFMSVDMPGLTITEEYDNDGNKTGKLVPTFDFFIMYFIHRNKNGEVVWDKNWIDNPECFQITEYEPMKKYMLYLQNFPDFEEGTYEFVVSSGNKEYINIVENVN